MRRLKKILLFFSLLLLIPNSVHALDCDYNLKAKLKKIASNINTSYVPVESENGVTFNVTISNIYPGILVVDPITGTQYTYDETRSTPNAVEITGLQPDKTYKYEVYATNDECNDSSLNIYYVILPSYNIYYKDPLCEGISDYKLCNKWINTNLTYEQFVDQVNSYKESLNKVNQENKVIDKDNNPIIEFILEYYYIFIILIVLGCGYVIYIRRKRDSFGF